MRNKKEDAPKKGAPAYMNTYGDLMTLLLTFFVLLFSMSEVDANKFASLVDSFGSPGGILIGGETINEYATGSSSRDKEKVESEKGDAAKRQELDKELSKVEEELENFINENGIESYIAVDKNDSEVVIRFDDVLLFDTGKASIKEEGIPVLSAVGEELKDYVKDGYRIRFEGHTDNVPIRKAQFPSNWELSASRAIAGAKFFIEEMGYEPSVISAEGFGEYRPIADNSTSEGRAQNRRMEIKVTKQSK